MSRMFLRCKNLHELCASLSNPRLPKRKLLTLPVPQEKVKHSPKHLEPKRLLLHFWRFRYWHHKHGTLTIFNFSLFQIIKVLLQSFDYALEKAEEGKTEARRGGKGLLLTL